VGQVLEAHRQAVANPTLDTGGLGLLIRSTQARTLYQIRYAADDGMFDQAEAFIDGLRPDEWHTCSPSGLDWNYGDAIAEDERKRDRSND
jgi:hypothetical protein